MIIPLPISIYHKNIRHRNRHTPHFLSFKRFFYFVFLSLQIVLFFIKAVTLFAKFFHTLQLRPHSFPAVRLNLLVFPGQIADCIIVFLYLLRQAYPVYQILHFLIRFVKVCFCHNFCTQPHHDFLFHISRTLSIPFPIGSFQRNNCKCFRYQHQCVHGF